MITNDVLAAKQDTLSAQLGELKATIDGFASTYARSDLLDLRFKEIDLQIAGIAKDIVKLQNRKNFLGWLLPTVAAVLGALLTLLISFYISNVNK